MTFRRIAAWGVPPLLAILAAGAWWARPPKLNASLYDLIGREAERIPAFVREASASEVAIVVRGRDGGAVRKTARAIAARLGHGPSDAESPFAGAALDFLRANRAGLVTPEAASLLETEAGRAKLARRALRRLYGSPVPPLLGWADDPFGLTEAFAATLMPKPAAVTDEGLPVIVTNGETRVLVRHRLDAATAGNLDATIAFCDALRKTAREAGGVSSAGAADGRTPTDGVSVHFAGAPVHAARSAGRCRGEIGALTWFSLAVIAALALFAFRSLRWLPLLAGSLAVAALAGLLALVLAFREIHVMTLVMGTTVLGLVIDYSFHWLLSPEVEKASVRKGLFVSFATTEISLVPLMLASIPVLRQSAVFLGVALAAALGYVVAGYPLKGASSHLAAPRPPLVVVRVLSFLAVLVALAGLFRLTFRTEVSALYRPPSELIEAERLRASFGTFDLSVFPTLAERRATAERVAALYAEHGTRLAETLGLAALVPPSAPRDLLLEPRRLMDAILGAWTREALARLGLAVAVLLVVLAVLTRRRAVRILVPPVAAILAVAGALGWCGASVNLFHLLAAFLLLGMGIDYAVFLGTGEGTSFKPALCSMLTSVAGFGALAFVSFPVVASFGVVLGLGLPLAFGLACAAPRARAEEPEAPASVECGASLLGMEILFLLYRILGLRALHALAAAVGASVWLFSRKARRASPRLAKVVSFTRSLADKLVVMAEGRRLPAVVTDGHPDAADFLRDVRSGRGVFVLSSHVGTVEVLTALGACERTFHAWMDFDRTGVFNRFYLRHAKRRRVVIHPIAEFGMQTVFAAGDLIDGGACLLMAGDRGDGAFRFAAAFDHPVYFVACIAERGCRYRAIIRRLPSDRTAMASAYAALLSSLAAAHPDQHFVWRTAGESGGRGAVVLTKSA